MGERTVNAQQREVLGWIVDGCPEGVMTDTSYKTTAVALQNRRLVRITRKQGRWEAKATEAGRHFAAHGEYPSGHWSAPPAPPVVPGTSQAVMPQPGATTPTPRRVVTGVRPVDQMMVDLAEAGGSLEVEDGAYYERLVASANRYGKVPAGKLLELRRTSRRQAVIELVERPAWMAATLEPIPIPQTLAKPHPVIAALNADRQRVSFRAPVRRRALRLLNAIAQECQRRGHHVKVNPVNQRSREHAPGDLTVRIQAQDYHLQMVEQTDRVPHVPSNQELRDQERWAWRTIPTHDRVASGRLELRLHGGCPVSGDTFADTKTRRLDDRLPALIQELELRAAQAERLRLKREAEAARRREEWEHVRQKAVLDFTEHHRGRILVDQAEQWVRAQQVSAYLDALRSRIEHLGSDERSQAEMWLAWGTTFVKTLDPLVRPPSMPQDPTPTPEDLKPFMRGLSPYGPGRW